MTLVPTLSANGYLSAIGEKADKLLAYYITSEYSQSFIYYGNVTSLPYHIQTFANDPGSLEITMRDSLTKYFGRYFTNVVVDVNAELTNVDAPNDLNIQLDIEVTDGNSRYSLGREIKAINGKIKEIIDILR